MKVVVTPPRTIPAPEAQEAKYAAWVEITLVIQLRVPDWGVDEVVFAHWAMPWEGEASAGGWRRFDPGARAARPSAPLGVPEVTLNPERAKALVDEVRALVPRRLHRQPALGMVSQFGEELGSFRHRCLRAFAPSVQQGLLRRDPQAARAVAQMVDGIETRELTAEEGAFLEARVGLAYYPQGVEPRLLPDRLMVEGGKGWQA
ncbi:MAG: hypothetical protein NZ869_05405 [Thermoanaerobaculum sp.]|nr:hypothetical protein [Thermoanaerobaculum sp.]MDW7967601.1 hypothetical protein [Thermoanaerobaculum sp.]